MKAVIFDLGRVLVHWDFDRTLQGLGQVSRAEPARLRAIVAAIGPATVIGLLDAGSLHRYLIKHAGATADAALFARGFCSGLARNEEALAYARSLGGRQNVKVAVISNTNPVHTRWLHDAISELQAMDTVILSCEVGLRKPDSKIYWLAVERLALAPANCFFLDDLAENVAAAQAAGMAGLVHSAWDASRTAIDAWLAGA